MEYVLISVVGAMIGSFIGMLSYRLPLDMDIVIKRSACAKCHHNLGIFDLVPIMSWIIALGKCRYCKESISPRYIFIEVITVLIACFSYYKFGMTINAILYFTLGILILTLITTDLEHYIIPDSIQILLAINALGIAYVNNNPFSNLILPTIVCLFSGLLLKFGFIFIRKKDGLGSGDVKLMIVAGMYLGLSILPIFFFIAGLTGIVTAVIWRMLGKGAIFPFGPALAIAMVVCLLTPEIPSMINDYVIKYEELGEK